jgi:RNA polymerase sigma-70 factor (ECF subfamily)
MGIQSHPTDEMLVEKYKDSGNVEVLGQLYQPYMPLVYGVCLKYLKERSLAQDAVMEIFEKLVSELRSKTVDRFRPWLYVVAKNHCLMHLRHQKSVGRQEKEFKESLVDVMELPQQVHPMDDEGASLSQQLRDCVERLKGQQKQSIELFYFEQKCYDEIAVMMQVEKKKVKSYIQNGKRNLKICLEQKHV